jgi:hypothetical protein
MLDKKINNANPHSQAHLQFAQASTQPKIAKELVCLPPLNLPTLKKLNLFRQRKRND